MRNFNINQKRVITDVLVNLSVAFILISTVGQIITKAKLDNFLLISIFFIVIISLFMIFYSIKLMDK